MSFNDKILERYDTSVDDEFERETLYRSMAISYAWAINLTFVACAILAWVLPGLYSMWAVLPMAFLIFAMATGDRWRRQRTPSPRPTPYSKIEYVLIALVSLLVISGVYKNTLGIVDSDISRGFLIGGVMSVVCSIFIMKNISIKQRQRDRERLDAQLDQEI